MEHILHLLETAIDIDGLSDLYKMRALGESSTLLGKGDTMKLRNLVALFIGLGMASWTFAADTKKEGEGEKKDEQIVAAKGSEVFHLASCTVAARIKAENKVVYKSGKEAVDAGLKPCAKCNPPTTGAATPPASAADSKVVCKKDDKGYHLASCKAMAGVKAEDVVEYANAQAAFDAGCTACADCKAPVSTKVVGSKESDKYHLASCRFAKNIKDENLRTWDSTEAAAKDNAAPCGACKPPAAKAADEPKKEEVKESPKKEETKEEPKKTGKKRTKINE